jgi:hypothetical protein
MQLVTWMRFEFLVPNKLDFPFVIFVKVELEVCLPEDPALRESLNEPIVAEDFLILKGKREL